MPQYKSHLLCCWLLLGALWLPLEAHAKPTAETTHFQFQYPPKWASEAQYLVKRAEKDVVRLERLFGYKLQRKIQVRISAPGNAFAAIQPHGWRPHSDIAGLAYPERSLITLKIRRIEGLQGLHQTFVHEICHILFAHASHFRKMPLWLNEGVAMWLSNDFGDFERFISLSRARTSGQIPSLDRLERRFPSHPATRKLAYGTSLDITLFLRKQRKDFLPALMAAVRKKQPWRKALATVHGRSWEQLQKEWRGGLATRYGWVALVANEGTIWIVAVFLFLLAYMRIRRERRAQWALLDDEADEAFTPSLQPSPAPPQNP